MKKMSMKQVTMTADLTVGEAARATAKLFRNKYRSPILVAWHDRRNRRAGPMEACDGQPVNVARSYARSNGAETCVQVDGGHYTLWYRRTPHNTIELDREACLDIHRDLSWDDYENVQGG